MEVNLDLSGLQIPRGCLEECQATAVSTDEIAADSTFAAQAEQLLGSWPELRRVGEELKQHLLRGPGYVIVRGFPFLDHSVSTRDLLVLGIAQALGMPTPTGGSSSRYVWEVKPRRDLAPKRRVTISERAGPAALHTDSQYRLRPEAYFALFVVRPAMTGGETLLLPAQILLENLISTTNGRTAWQLLQTLEFPFRVPSAFCDTESIQAPEYIKAPIFTEAPLIRYRYDTLMEGFAVAPWLATKDSSWAVSVLESEINSSGSQIASIGLRRGEIIFVNNHCVLHGRNDFRDPNRLLLRVRINTPSRPPSSPPTMKL